MRKGILSRPNSRFICNIQSVAFIFCLGLILGISVKAWSAQQDLLIKFSQGTNIQAFTEALVGSTMSESTDSSKVQIQQLGGNWVQLKPKGEIDLQELRNNPAVEYVQPNFKIRLLENYRENYQENYRENSRENDRNPNLASRVEFLEAEFSKNKGDKKNEVIEAKKDNPPIPEVPQQIGSGPDPELSKQWGMLKSGAKAAWAISKGGPNIIVAVIDTGVDYTHEDLLPNLWRNPGESGLDSNSKDKATNGIDDDNNGFVDDVIGWDFVSKDNKPFDLSVDPKQLLIGGGNPGHGTHCAGNVGARGENGKGVSGAAPLAKIMSLRFISEKGEGTTADAVKALRYAVDNGALVLSNSWGSEGEDPKDQTENLALREAIQYTLDKGALFVGAAGNGHNGKGYNNDTDKNPAYPASYDFENIVSVAALDSSDKLGNFSNWGMRSVDLGAPGVKVFSTTVGSKYSDTVLSMGGFSVYWDGTSMATPHVAGAAALYWSTHPEKSWLDVKNALLKSVTKIDSLKGKAVSEGKLNLEALMKQ